MIELKKLLATGLGIKKTDKELEDLFQSFDLDKSGAIEFEEFVKLAHKLNWHWWIIFLLFFSR